MTEDEATRILLKAVADGNQVVASEIKSAAVFSWQCVHHNPTTWQLGWYHAQHNALYYPLATITRRPDGTWFVMAHLYGKPTFYGNEPSKPLAMEKAEAFLSANAPASTAPTVSHA